MEQEPGSGSNSNKRNEGPPEGGTTSSADNREADGYLEASQELGTINQHVERSKVTDNPNTVNGIAGVQVTDADEDFVSSEDSDSNNDLNHTSEQGGSFLDPAEEIVSSEDMGFNTNDSTEGTVSGPSDQEDTAAISTGNANNQQTPDGWTIVDHEKSVVGTVPKGEVCRKFEKNSELIIEVQQQITRVQHSLCSDDTPRPKSLGSDRRIVEMGTETEGEFATDSERKDVQALKTDNQATSEGSYAASAAFSQILESSPATVEFAASKPSSVVSKAQDVGMLSSPRSVKETHTHFEPQGSLCNSKSLKETSKPPKETLRYSNSLKETLRYSNSLKETSICEEGLTTTSVSGTKKEINRNSEAPRTISTSISQEEFGMRFDDSSAVSASAAEEESSEIPEDSSTISTPESQEEVDVSHEVPSAASASAAGEESNEISEAPSIVLNSETQKQVSLSLKDPRMASISETLKEVSVSSKAASEVSASEGQEGNSVISETPNLAPTSEARIVGPNQVALSMVFYSVVQKDVDSISEAINTLSTSEAQEEVSGSSEASGMVSNFEVSKAVGLSSDSQSAVPTPETQEKIDKNSETSNMLSNSEVQNVWADDSSRASEAGEISGSSESPSTVSTSEVQKDFGTSPGRITPRAEVPSKELPPEGLQRSLSQIDDKQSRDSLLKSPRQYETTDIREGLPQAGIEERKDTSVSEGDIRERDYSLTSTFTSNYEKNLIPNDKTTKDLKRRANNLEVNYYKGQYQALRNGYKELNREYIKLRSEKREMETKCAEYFSEVQYFTKYVRNLHGQLEQMKKECGTLQNQILLYEKQHANEHSGGGSYLDDTKAATPALLLSALNGVRDASSNFVKVLKASIHPGFDSAYLERHIGAVSRNGHSKFQYQAYICRILFRDFDLPFSGSSKDGLPSTTCFHQYQIHDLKKTDTVERLLRHDEEIDASLHEFCFGRFQALMLNVRDLLPNKGIDLMQQVENKQHAPRDKLYVSFCKLAVSVWLLQRLAFSFLRPAKLFTAHRGEPFDLNRMQSVVPLDESGSDEEVRQRVGFYVLPGFDIGNSAIPCEVYVTLE